MAELTGEEQVKQTQTLEKIQTGQTEVVGKLDSVISSLQQTGAHEEAIVTMAKQSEDDQKSLKKTDDKKITLSEKSTKILEDNANALQNLTNVFEESGDDALDHQKFIEVMERRKMALQETVFEDNKRKDKLSTRDSKGMWGWVKGKGNAMVKSAGSFFEKMLKLIGLLLLWWGLTWLKTKDLKAMFENFKNKIKQFIDDWIPQWIQDLDWGWQLGLAIASLAGAWYGLKLALRKGWQGIKRIAGRITGSIGPKGALMSQLDEVVDTLDGLHKQRNALVKARDKLPDGLGEKSKLSTQIDEVEAKIVELTDQKNAIKKAAGMEVMLDQNSALATQIDELDDGIAKLTKNKDNIIKKAGGLKEAMEPGSPWAKQLDAVMESIDELTKQRNVLQKTIDMNNKTMDDLLLQEKLAKQNAAKPGQVWNEKAQRWQDAETGKFVKEADVPDTVKGKPTTTAPELVVDDLTPEKTPGFMSKLWESVNNNSLVKGVKKVGTIVGKTADVIGRKVLLPLEIARGVSAGWKASEGEDWDMRIGMAVKGGVANTADLVFTDTLRGVEAISGLIQDMWNDKEFGTTEVDYGSKAFKTKMEKEIGAFVQNTTLEGMLDSGEFSVWDILGVGENAGKVWGTDGAAWDLKMDKTKGGVKTMLDERAELRKSGGAWWLRDTEQGQLLNKILLAQEKNAALQEKTLAMGQSRDVPGVTVVDKSMKQVIGKSNTLNPMNEYISYVP